MEFAYVLPDPASYRDWTEFDSDLACMKQAGYDAVELQNSSAVSEARATMPEHVPKFLTPEHRNTGTLQVRLRFFIVRCADNHGVRPFRRSLNCDDKARPLGPDPVNS